MSATVAAFLRSWPFDPWLLGGLLLCAVLYARGWRHLHRRDPQRWHLGLLSTFLGGLGAVALALASPLEPFASLSLPIHMVQHLLLMMVAPPLLWLGAPLLPLLRGLPRPILVTWVVPLLALPPLRALGRRLTHPLMALGLFVAVSWVGHLPPVYDRALRSPTWHYAQHVAFLGSALLFWHAVVRPSPSQPTWSAWLLLPTLLLADLANTVLAALLTFSDRVLYAYYTEVPPLVGTTPLDDQATAGVLMWVPGSIAFLVPLCAITVRLLSGSASQAPMRPVPRTPAGRIALPLVRERPAPLDVLRLPLLGRFLRWRHARLALQAPLLCLAGLVVFDGFCGPQAAPLNLAGVLPWVHWRGLLVLGLLAAGNVFCMGCPFLLPRTLARRWLPARWAWPRRLRGKWPALLLLLAFLWAYEALALWDRPWWTACLVLGYFGAAFAVDGLFRGASFCKSLCPIGQFNFVLSLASPLEIAARDPAVCSSCETKDCLRGRSTSPTCAGPAGKPDVRSGSQAGKPDLRGSIPGCELNLFVPRKVGNMDCTLCLDCVHACPHDNIGLVARVPGAELWDERPRSGVGRLSRRLDVAALVVVVVFGAFANAAGMVGPVVRAQAWAVARGGVPSPLLATTLFYVLALVVLPFVAVGAAAALSRRWAGLGGSMREVALRYVCSLVPLGFGMWLAHYSFHFLPAVDAVVPATRRLAEDLGVSVPAWSTSWCRVPLTWLLPLELLFLDMGLLLSLYSAYRLAANRAPGPAALKAAAPWALLLLVLFAAGVWIVFQPMEMRGVP